MSTMDEGYQKVLVILDTSIRMHEKFSIKIGEKHGGGIMHLNLKYVNAL